MISQTIVLRHAYFDTATSSKGSRARTNCCLAELSLKAVEKLYVQYNTKVKNRRPWWHKNLSCLQLNMDISYWGSSILTTPSPYQSEIQISRNLSFRQFIEQWCTKLSEASLHFAICWSSVLMEIGTTFNSNIQLLWKLPWFWIEGYTGRHVEGVLHKFSVVTQYYLFLLQCLLQNKAHIM